MVAALVDHGEPNAHVLQFFLFIFGAFVAEMLLVKFDKPKLESLSIQLRLVVPNCFDPVNKSLLSTTAIFLHVAALFVNLGM